MGEPFLCCGIPCLLERAKRFPGSRALNSSESPTKNVQPLTHTSSCIWQQFLSSNNNFCPSLLPLSKETFFFLTTSITPTLANHTLRGGSTGSCEQKGVLTCTETHWNPSGEPSPIFFDVVCNCSRSDLVLVLGSERNWSLFLSQSKPAEWSFNKGLD